MSLGKLLTAGKSLVGLNGPARYQLRKGALPKFDSARNPFARPPEPETEPQLPKMTPAEIAAANLKKTQHIPSLVEVAEREKAEEAAKAAEAAKVVAGPVDSWLKKLNPLVWFENRKPAPAKSAIPRFNKPPVQGELSLDNIKVMRNDLSDADVEVRPMKIKVSVSDVGSASAGAAAAAMVVPDLPPARDAWEFLGERLLGKH
jgi:hypothetical protein